MSVSRRFFAFFLSVTLAGGVFAAEGAAAPTAEPNAAPTAAEIEARRRDTIRYGTDAEILKLVIDLEAEKTDYLDDELLRVLEATKNGKIASSVFGFFARKKNATAESRALRILRERDQEANEAVDAAIGYLGDIASREAPAPLREILDAEETRFQDGAVRALGKTGGDDADGNAAFLLSYFEDREIGEGVKQSIIGALGALGSKKATPFLSDLARNGDEKAVRRMAALESIGKIGDPEALEAVLEALGTGDPNVRAVAVATLGPFTGEKVDSAILEAFRDSFYKTRSAAAKAAGERKLEAAVSYLRYRAERDEVAAVRDDAIRALGKIGSAPALQNVREVFDEKKNPDRARVVAAETLLASGSGESALAVVAALEEAKSQKRTALANGLLKALAAAKSPDLEDFARRLLGSADLTDKLYALDLVRGNKFRALSDDVAKLTEDKNAAVSRRARDVLASFEAP